MLPMSSSGKANATNGRHGANDTAAKITTTTTRGDMNIKSSKKTVISTSNAVTKSLNVTTTTTPTTLPEKTLIATTTNNSMTAIKSINNDNSNVFGNNSSNNTILTTTTTTNSTSTKNYEKERISCSNSSTSSSNSVTTNSTLQQQQQKQQQQQNILLGGNRRDERKYQYSRPQTLPPMLANNNSIKTTTTTTQTQSLETTTTTLCNDECDSINLDSMLVYYDGELISGKLESLIEHMVPTNDYYPTHHYLFAFLLSARLFVRPYELLAQISKTWEKQQQQQQQSSSSSIDVVDVATTSALSLKKIVDDHQHLNIQKSAQHCIRLLSEWIETFPYDFRDERLMQQVRILARKCIYIDTSLGKQVSQILQLLVQRLTALEKYEEYLQILNVQQQHQQQQQNNQQNTTTTNNLTNVVLSNNTTTTQQQQQQPTATIGHLHKTYRDKQQQQQQHNKNSLNLTANEHKLHNNYNNTNNTNNHEQSKHQQQQQQQHYTHNNYQQQQQQLNIQNHGTLTTTTIVAPSSITTTTNLTNDLPNLVLGIMDICSSCAQLAHQLTAIELECLSHIGPEEFVQAFAKEYQQTKKAQQTAITNTTTTTTTMGNNSCSFNDMKKTRNLESYVEWFNRLSYLTATEIVKYPKKKQRVRVIEYWIETARECFNIGNFNSLMAIIAGLNLAPISRLKKTWSKVQSAKFSVLEHQMDPTSNFNSYRSTLKAAMWRFEGATDEREKIIIPFFSLFVKDLYFLNEGCSNRLPNNHINFEKCTHLAKQVMEFNEWKQVACPFEKFPNVIAFLQNSAVLNENTLSIASFECEPPENTEEKGRYKTVKAETKQQLLQQLQEKQNQH